MRRFEVVILAAGLGTRLGRPHPKPLTRLSSGQSIIRRAVDSIRAEYGPRTRVTAVVGFKMDLLIEEMADICFIYNENFDSTNTSKSLLKAINLSDPEAGMLWLNGDVVFDPQALGEISQGIDRDENFVAVNTEAVGEEEVKYRLGPEGDISELSKQVTGGLGEAVGINYVRAQDKAALAQRLAEVPDQQYFEGGIELAITKDSLSFKALDISQFDIIEVDFDEDLKRVNARLG